MEGMINRIESKRITTANGYWDELLIDGVPLRLFFKDCVKDDLSESVNMPFNIFDEDGLTDLSFTWIEDYYWKGIRDFIWHQIESSEDEVVPVLSCPECCEELDCLLLVVYVRKDNDFVYWDKLGRVLHPDDRWDRWIVSGYMIKDELSQEICRKHGMDIDNYLLCEIEPNDFYNDIGWRDECYLRMMHFDRELYNSPGGIKWITDVGWKFDREQYENCTAYLKKAYNIDA